MSRVVLSAGVAVVFVGLVRRVVDVQVLEAPNIAEVER